MRDPVTFRSDRLPTEHFDRRFSDDNLAFWVPLIVDAARIAPGLDVLDVGCGTGGIARAVAETAAARVVGYDLSERFVDHARTLAPPARGTVEWAVGDAERLPFDSRSFDRVLLSLVLHQLARPRAAVAEAFRVLRAGGVVLVRTIAPEDVADRVPERYVSSMAEADAGRLPPLEAVERWLEEAGFTLVATERHLRNKRLDVEEQERELLTEARCRYPFITSEELEEGARRMRADATAAAPGEWVDPRPTYFIVASKRAPGPLRPCQPILSVEPLVDRPLRGGIE